VLQTGFWSTDRAQSPNRVDYWRQAICEAMFELDFQAASNGLDACLRQYKMGAVKLSEVSISTAHQVVRSRQAAVQSQTPKFNLNYVRTGSWEIEHYGRTFTLGAGELVLLDNRHPYRVTAAAGTEHICVNLPLEWLRCWMPDPEGGIARPITSDMPWQRTLTALLEDTILLSETAPDLNDLCAQQIAGALSLALGSTGVAKTNHTRLLLRRIKSAIADMFCDPELDAVAVAAALGISPRYLHKVLAREGTTYSRELIRLRLDRARAMLSDRRFDQLSVAEIGHRCGFCDPSHFSRRFKNDTGMNPGGFRELSHQAHLEGLATSQ
jgi:AraC-like DNA-binding protein